MARTATTPPTAAEAGRGWLQVTAIGTLRYKYPDIVQARQPNPTLSHRQQATATDPVQSD